MILSFKEYLQEASNCPDGKKYCPKCQMCVEKTCEEKKMMKEEAWQRKEGKNKSGGLNEKGRKAYEGVPRKRSPSVSKTHTQIFYLGNHTSIHVRYDTECICI